MQFGPLELQACGENNFTMKALGLLAFRPDLRARFVRYLFGEAAGELRGDAISILFFSRIGEGFFREAIEREERGQAISTGFETKLNQTLGLPERFKWRRNSDGRLTQPAKWQDVHIQQMLDANNMGDDWALRQKLSYLQDCLNTEPDLVMQWGTHVALIEIKVLSGEGTQQLDRQRKLGEFLGGLLGWTSHFSFIGPAHGSRPSWDGCGFKSWEQIAEWYTDTPEISEYIREFAFFYRGCWQSMVSERTHPPAKTAYDLLSASDSVARAPSESRPAPTNSSQRQTNPKPATAPSLASLSGDPWHFSHLRRPYFETLVWKCRQSGHWPIKFIWTGRTGVAYAEKASNNRAINANWMIETVDGRRRTNGQRSSYDSSRMHRWPFSEIAEHFRLASVGAQEERSSTVTTQHT